MQYGEGQYFSDNSVHQSFNRAITIHGTDYAVVENNFCYDHIGHGLFLEDGAERFNVIRKNVVLLTKRPLPGDELTPSDNSHDDPQNRSPSSYWITNPNNVFEDNVAAGSQGTGFWFIPPDSPLVPSKNLPYYSNLKPHEQPLGSFSKNKAHSCMNGFDIFDRLTQGHAIQQNGGWNNAALRLMDRCTWYANDTAIYAGIGDTGFQDNVIYRDNVFVDNRTGLMLATYNIVEQSIFVADSGDGLLSGNRMLYRAYDGAGTVRDSHLVGWNASHANFLQNTGAAVKHVNHKFHGITTDHSGTVRMAMDNFDIPQPSDAHANHAAHPRVWSIVLRDIDGSLSGKANTSIVSNHPFLRIGDEHQPSNWSRIFRSDHKFAIGIEDNGDRPRPNVGVTRTKIGTPPASLLYIKGYNEHHQLPLIVNEGFLYTYTYNSLPVSKSVSFQLDDASVGDTVTVRFTGFGSLTGITVTGHSAAAHASLASLESSNSSGYFIQPSGEMYLRTVATGKNQVMTIRWTGGVRGVVPDSDGDGLNDIAEIEIGRDPQRYTDFGAEFINDANFENWENFPANTTTSVSGGILIWNSTGDSMIQNSLLNIAATELGRFAIRMKSSTNSPVSLFWGRESEVFSEERRIGVPYTGGGDWQILEFPFSEHSAWSGIIKRLGLDLSESAGSFQIDWIRAIARGVDSDGDGIQDMSEGFDDVDGDNLLNYRDGDADGDLMEDGNELLAGRLPYHAGDLAFHYNTDGATEGWVTNANTSGFQIVNGVMRGTSVIDDPVIVNNNVHFKTDQVKQVVMKIRSSHSGWMELFFGTLAEPGHASTRRIAVYYSVPNTWQIVVFNLQSHVKWPSQTVQTIRIDPTTTANATWEIDWIHASNGDSFAKFMEEYPLIDGMVRRKSHNADGDGFSNFQEFAYGSDPGVLGSFPKFHTNITVDPVTGRKHFLLTKAVRKGCVFLQTPSPTATVNGINYTMLGTTNLNGNIAPVEATITPSISSLPPLPANYEYRSFRFVDPIDTLKSGFIQSKVEVVPSP